MGSEFVETGAIDIHKPSPDAEAGLLDFVLDFF